MNPSCCSSVDRRRNITVVSRVEVSVMSDGDVQIDGCDTENRSELSKKVYKRLEGVVTRVNRATEKAKEEL